MGGLTLYHYTCDHGHAKIGGLLLPAARIAQAASGGPGEYVWLTDLAVPSRDALGLTSHILSCDRTAHRYRVTNDAAVSAWVNVRRRWPWAEELESAPGARPRHWFVSALGVPAIYDPILATAASP